MYLDHKTAERLAQALFKLGVKNRRQQHRGNFAVPRKADGSPVTEIDHYNNHELRRLLMELFGSEPLLIGEEDGDVRWQGSPTWVVYIDPIDGTYQCAADMDGSTSLLGFFRNGAPEAGFIVRPAKFEVLYGGLAIGGIYRLAQGRSEQLPRRVLRHGRLWGCDQAYVTHDQELTRRYRAFIDARAQAAQQRGVKDFYTSFPSGESLALLLNGSYSFYINCAASPWDAAPAAALVPLVGGDIRYLASGKSFDWSQPSRAPLQPYVVAESPAVAEAVCALWNQG